MLTVEEFKSKIEEMYVIDCANVEQRNRVVRLLYDMMYEVYAIDEIMDCRYPDYLIPGKASKGGNLIICYLSEKTGRQRIKFSDVPFDGNRPITPRHIAKKKRSETDLSNSNKFSIWQHRNIRTK